MTNIHWRCKQCGKRLGDVKGNRLHIRFSRGHQYIVGFPATVVCRDCETLNEVVDGQNVCEQNLDHEQIVKR